MFAGSLSNRTPFPHDNSIVNDGLLIAYDFSQYHCYPRTGNTVLDVASKTYSGTLLNTPTYTTDKNGGLTFTRTDNDAINLGDTLDELWTNPNGKFTVELWLQFNTLINDVNYSLFSKLGDSSVGENQRQFLLRAVNLTSRSFGGVRLDYLNYGDLGGSYNRGVRSNTLSLVIGNYYYIVVTYDASITSAFGLDRVNFYINNSVQSKVMWLDNNILVPSTADGTARLGIGAALGTSATPYGGFDGNIYAFSLYDKVLTPAEIAYNWNGKKSRFGL